MKDSLNVLFVEDSTDDALLLLRELRRGGWIVMDHCVETAVAMDVALEAHAWDVIISDFSLPQFSGLAALAMVRARGLDTPFILVSGAVGEEIAVEAMKAGANDYLFKGNLARLTPAIRREIHEAKERQSTRRIKLQLELSEIRHRRLFETAHDGILLVDARTRKIIDVNRFMVDMLHYPAEHFLGKELWEIGAFNDIGPITVGISQLLGKDTVLYKEIVLKDSRGQSIPVEFVNSNYSEGKYDLIQCNIQNISERKQMEALDSRMTAIVESSDDAIVSISLKGDIETWNPGAESIFKYNAIEVIGHSMALLFPSGRLDEELKLREQLGRGECIKDYETVRIDKNNKRVDVSLTASPIRDHDGRVVGSSRIMRDISSRKRTDYELAKAKEDAEAANRSKSEFLANMSHEIRTPMNAILGFANMVVHKNQGKAARIEWADIIRRNALHLLELINEILDLSKIEAGQMVVERICCDLPTMLSEIISLMRPRAIEKNLEFSANFEGPIPRWILTDPTRLRQVLVNLLGNAIKFTDTGKVALKVSIESDGSPNLVLRVDVSDSGIGMSQEQLQKLFQPFTQGDASITRKFGGTGLGLTISRRLARLLIGDITVSSELGAGSIFTLKIDGGDAKDVECLHELTEATLPTTPTHGSEDIMRLQGRILLVEDGRDNQRLLQMQLGEAGAEVMIAENGQIALDMTASQSFDLILMDMQMPVMDGYTATLELRRRGLVIPIIALTANAMAEDRNRCLASGCSDYLTKPVDEATLLSTVNQYLGSARSDGTVNRAMTDTAVPKPIAVTTVHSGRIKSSLANDPRMMAIIPEFVNGLPAEVRMLTDFLDRNELSELRQVVHQLRGASGGYGFDPISESAAKAEESIKTGQALASIAAATIALIAVIRSLDGYDERNLPLELGKSTTASAA